MKVRFASVLPSRESLLWQVLLVVAVWAYLVGLHWHTDGLWSHDSVRHAANGMFWKEFLGGSSWNFLAFGHAYYARYPIINPLAYPPVFYFLEAPLFSLVGPSPYAAKGLVLAFALLAALYGLAWLRRYVLPEAGWAAAALLLEPGIVVWSHGIMLNVPAMALALAALYHARRALETLPEAPLSRHWYAAAALTVLAVLTHPTTGVIVFVMLAWLIASGRARALSRRWMLWLGGAGALMLGALVFVVLRWSTIELNTVVPEPQGLLRLKMWTSYARHLPEIFHRWSLLLALAGALGGLASRRWRRETMLLLLWIGVCYLVFSLMVARESRYFLVIAVAMLSLNVLAVLVAAEGLEWAFGRERRAAHWVLPVFLGAFLVTQIWAAPRIRVFELHGFEELATAYEQIAPEGVILYGGQHYGDFGFYLLAGDPGHQRRLVRGDQLLNGAGNNQELLTRIRTQSGCRWLALESGGRSDQMESVQLLHQAVRGPEFRWVRSFPVKTVWADHVDLYEILLPLETPENSGPPLVHESSRGQLD